jgi:hypothetical protein
VSLGKRYIALTPKLLHGPDWPLRDEDGHVRYTHELHHNARMYDQQHRARTEANRWIREPQREGHGRVLEVDLDELRDLDATSEYEHAERQMLRWTEEEERLRPDRSESADSRAIAAAPPSDDEPDQLEAMQTVLRLAHGGTQPLFTDRELACLDYIETLIKDALALRKKREALSRSTFHQPTSAELRR